MSRVVIALVWASLFFALAPSADAQPAPAAAPDARLSDEAKQQRFGFLLGFWANPGVLSDPYIEMIRGTYPLAS